MIEAHHLHKSYGSHQALEDLNLQIPKGSIFGLLGPNGAGKTSFIRILNQIIAPDQGRVSWQGQPLGPAHNARVGYLPEERGLYPQMAVEEQLLYLAQLKGMSAPAARREIGLWLERFDLGPWRRKALEALSKGMAQKVQFIATVLHQPELLIFDEPFSGFDPLNTERLKAEILRLREAGATVIFSTHRMDSVEEICDRVALLHGGRKLLDGSLEEVKSTYRSGLYLVELGPGAQVQWPESCQLVRTERGAQGQQRYWLQLDEAEGRRALWEALHGQDLRRFEAEEPRLHDIFVQLVQEES